MAPTSTTHYRIAIIGAGFGGIGTGIQLREHGETDFVIFDKAAGIGGTWWVNRYPGCACDVPSHLYSFSFAPNPDWSRRFAPREEIQRYLEGLVDQYHLADHIRLNTEIARIEWQAAECHWRLEDDAGRAWSADVVVTALGGLSRPAWPEIEGLSEFRGKMFHSQRWDKDHDLTGRKVAVIGTGASGVQLVPEVAEKAARLDIYQRTPSWIIPRWDRAISRRRRRLYRRWPWLQKLARFSIWAVSEMRVPAFVWLRQFAAGHRLLAHWHRRRQVADARLHRHLKPDYDIGCKRVLLSSDFYPTLNRDHVELVTSPIRRIEADAIVDGAGTRREIDTLVLATGFHATSPVPQGLIRGRNGRDLAQIWRDGPQAYKGTTVAGFPNLFMLMGPNTALGHNSVILMIESQIRYLLEALDYMDRARIVSIEVDTDRQAAWNRDLERRLATSVWNDGGCRSWYLHPESGRNSTIWPGFTLGFRRQLARFDPGAYEAVKKPVSNKTRPPATG